MPKICTKLNEVQIRKKIIFLEFHFSLQTNQSIFFFFEKINFTEFFNM